MSEEVKSVVRYIFEKTGDIVLKASTGLIIFLLVDGITSTFLSLLGKNIKPFEFTFQVYEIVKTLGDTFGYGYTILTIYILLWGWGQIVYILRQPLFLDNFKSDYLKWSLDKEIKKTYEIIREKVIEKLSLKANNLRNIIQQEKTNDYLLYQILGKYKALYPNTRGTHEANDIAFIATDIILISIVVYLYYVFEILLQRGHIETWKIIAVIILFPISIIFVALQPSKTKKYLLYLLISIVVFVGVFIPDLNIPSAAYTLSIIVIYFLFLDRVQNRLISRNLKIYINFLLHGSKLDEELREKKDNDNTASKRSDS